MQNDTRTPADSQQLSSVLAELLPLLKGLNELVQLALSLEANEQAQKLLTRLLSLADAVFIPEGGAGNFNLAATLLNRSPRSIEDMVKREDIPTQKPGSERVIRFADIAPEAASDQPQEVATEELSLLRTVNAMLGNDQFQKLAARFLSLADAVFIPEEGSGNVALAASLMNRDPASVRRIIRKRSIPTQKPGSETLVNFADILPRETATD